MMGGTLPGRDKRAKEDRQARVFLLGTQYGGGEYTRQMTCVCVWGGGVVDAECHAYATGSASRDGCCGETRCCSRGAPGVRRRSVVGQRSGRNAKEVGDT